MFKIIDRMIINSVRGKALAALGLASIPVLGVVLTPVVSYLIEMALTWALLKTVISGARLWVIENVDWNVKDVEKATTQLKLVLDHADQYTATQQAEIERNFDEAAVKLIHIVNARVGF